LFTTADGRVQLAVGSESLWRSFCGVIDLDPRTPDFATNAQRVANRSALIATIEKAFAGQSSAVVLAKLDAAGIPAGVLRSIDEVYTWPQTRSQGLIIEVEHPTLGTIELPGPPLRFFDADGAEQTRRDHAAPPTLGQNGDAVRAWLSETLDEASAES
jgi:formyl-CoA transferase